MLRYSLGEALGQTLATRLVTAAARSSVIALEIFTDLSDVDPNMLILPPTHPGLREYAEKISSLKKPSPEDSINFFGGGLQILRSNRELQAD